MKVIDDNLAQEFVQLAAKQLEGDWVLLGGTVLPLLGRSYRTTMDIDIAGPDNLAMSASLSLFSIAEQMGLPIEAINQAGAYFLHRIENWQQQIVLLAHGPSANIYRPSATLFLLLKIGRLSENDLLDCLEMINWARENGEIIEISTIVNAISKQINNPDCNAQKRVRLEKMQSAL